MDCSHVNRKLILNSRHPSALEPCEIPATASLRVCSAAIGISNSVSQSEILAEESANAQKDFLVFGFPVILVSVVLSSPCKCFPSVLLYR